MVTGGCGGRGVDSGAGVAPPAGRGAALDQDLLLADEARIEELVPARGKARRRAPVDLD
jgi:hypothetical protein